MACARRGYTADSDAWATNASLSSANDGETATARSNAPRGNGVGRSETGACVNAAAMVAPRSAPSVATSRPCCAAQDKDSSRRDARSASVIAGAPEAAAPGASAADARGRCLASADPGGVRMLRTRRPRARGAPREARARAPAVA